MQTSLKLKTCSRIFIAFLKATLNLEYFEQKDPSQSLSITEIIICKTCCYLNVDKGHPSCNASADNMLTGPKHYSDQQGTTFIRFFHYFR